MTHYNFDELVERRTSNSMKWAQTGKWLTPEQAAYDPLPMWVADMDFRLAPAIKKALEEELSMGVLGYGGTPDSYTEAVLDWQKSRFGWDVKPEWLVRTPGVVSAINMALQVFTRPGDEVIIMTPAYFHFLYDVTNNGRKAVEFELSSGPEGYFLEPDKLETFITATTRMLILCNPHNPTGNVWKREELLQIAEVCAKHNILVLSDEVHQDLIFSPSEKHIPFASISDQAAEISLICTAPSKTFNIAGLQCANIFIPNSRLRDVFFQQCDRCGITLSNLMATRAGEAAYRHSGDWADAMLTYVRDNQLHFRQTLDSLNLPVTVTPTPSLYLGWMDFRALKLADKELNDFLISKARLWLDPGSKFGKGGSGFMRINLACPRSLVDEALNRLSEALR